MRTPQPLPEPLASRSFSVREAGSLGVSPRRLRHPSLGRPARGARSHGPPVSVLDAAQSLAVALDGPWAYSHLTAARLLGLPLPHRWQPGERLHVMRCTPAARVRRPGVVGHRGLESRPLREVEQLWVVAPVPTWADLGPSLGVPWLVVLGDHLLHTGAASRAELAAAVRDRPGERGVRRLRQALPLVRAGSASVQETRARLLFLDGGLPEPELNVDVVSAEGLWLARVDFLWREARVVVEYEGDQHRTDRAQWERDVARTRDLEDDGWRVVRVTARDLATTAARAALVERLRRLILGW